MAGRMRNATKYNSKTIDTVFMFLLGAFMLIIPFYRGLFFRPNYILAIISISLIFIAFMGEKLRAKSYKVFDTYMDIAVLLIPAAYFLSFLFAVNAKDAFDAFLLYCSYFLLYKLVSSLSEENEKYKNIFINLIIASTFILSLTAMLNIAGIIDLKGVIVEKRLFGLYQYANTSASVLGVGIILTLNKLISEKDTRAVTIYQMVLTPLISSFIFTLSRGGYLVLAGVLLLNFLLVKANAKLKLLLSMFISFLLSSMLIYKFYILAEEEISAIWIHYLISIIVSAIIIYIIYSFKNRVKPKFSDKSVNIALIAAVLIFAGTAVFLFSVKESTEYRIEHKASEEKSWEYEAISLYDLKPNSEYNFEFDVKSSLESPYSYGILIRSYNSTNESTDILEHFESTGAGFTRKSFKFATLADTGRIAMQLYNYESNSYTVYKDMAVKDNNGITIKKIENLKYLPKPIADRLSDINMKTQNVSLRIYFMKDGLKIIKDYPIAGAGGGAWRSLYRKYQSIPYSTTEVHNFYVQYGTEVGIIGLAALIGLLVLLFLSMIKSIRTGSQYLYVYLAAMLLFIHSIIDFNLSLAAVGYMLWMLIGIINSDKYTPLIKKSSQKHVGALVLVLSMIICFASSSIYYGMKLGNQGAIVYNRDKDEDKTIELYEKAIKFDKYNGIYRADLAQILNRKLRDTKDKKYYDGLLEQLSMLNKYEPYNHKYTPTICNMYLSLGMFEEASVLADKKLQDEPLLIQSYIIKIDVNYQISNYYLKGDKVKEAELYLLRIMDAIDRFEGINANLKEPLKLSEDYIRKVQDVQRVLDLIKADAK